MPMTSCAVISLPPVTISLVAIYNAFWLWKYICNTYKKFQALSYHTDVVRGGCLSYIAPSPRYIIIVVLEKKKHLLNFAFASQDAKTLKKTFIKLKIASQDAILKVEHCVFLHLDAHLFFHKNLVVYFSQFLFVMLFPLTFLLNYWFFYFLSNDLDVQKKTQSFMKVYIQMGFQMQQMLPLSPFWTRGRVWCRHSKLRPVKPFLKLPKIWVFSRKLNN